jgi:predicted secreted protein
MGTTGTYWACRRARKSGRGSRGWRENQQQIIDKEREQAKEDGKMTHRDPLRPRRA